MAAQTVESGSASFLEDDELFDFIDSQQVASLLRDDPTAALPTDAQMTDGTSAPSVRLAKLLRAGSGEVEAACLPRGQYSVDDLNAIAASGKNAAWHLKRVTAGCTILALFGRRHNASGAQPQDYIAVAHAADALDRLRVGEHVFGLVDNIAAGAGTSAIEFVGRTDDDPDRAVNRAGRFFGSAGQRSGGW